MKTMIRDLKRQRGFSLLECAVSVGVLACGIPILLAAFGKAGACHEATMAESQAVHLVPACLRELQAAREGRGTWLRSIADMDLLKRDEVLALAVSPEGAILGQVSREDYQRGMKERDGAGVQALVRLTAKRSAARPQLWSVQMAVESPAAAPQRQRKACSFSTMIR